MRGYAESVFEGNASLREFIALARSWDGAVRRVRLGEAAWRRFVIAMWAYGERRGVHMYRRGDEAYTFCGIVVEQR
jgi:hypothetical protein